MHLARIEIANFRCFSAMEVRLQPGLNVLVGRNNVGKTALLSAIRYALGPSAARGDSLWLTAEDFHRRRGADAHETSMAVTLTFERLDEAERAFFYEALEFDHADPARSRAVIRFRATWDNKKRRVTSRRTCGVDGPNAIEAPSELLQALPVTWLPALRNAEEALAPGPKSRLASMLEDIAERRGTDDATAIVKIFADANTALQTSPLVARTGDSLRATSGRLAGSDYAAPEIRAAGLGFDRILRSLHVQVAGAPVESLKASGHGYNNLLYMAVVLEHLKDPRREECPLLLVEEPEAHLHPQLTTLLARYLAQAVPGAGTPQTLVSTHSPTLVASVPPERVHVIYADPDTEELRCNAFADVGLTDRESRAVQRMMDVTRASLYFAKGVILVEGICEALLIPALAERLGVDLAEHHVSIIPICGVAFETFKKLLGPDAFGVKAAIVTDGDPPVDPPRKGKAAGWRLDMPRRDGTGQLLVSDRTRSLLALYANHPSVQVFTSAVTLEFDLAAAGPQNAEVMAGAWEACFPGTPRNLNRSLVRRPSLSAERKALRVWRAVCRSGSAGSKADLAQQLAAVLADPPDVTPFVVPQYLADAIRFVAPVPRPPAAAPGVPTVEAPARV